MVNPDAGKWNDIYAAGGHGRETPARVLKEYAHLLPCTGTALDLACGRGANALFLAERGLTVHAWDISVTAITSLNDKASNLGLSINTRVCDVTAEQLPPGCFDVIVISYFLERNLIPEVINALKKNGLLYYQTFIRERVDDSGPCNDDYRLAENELMHLCRDLRIVLYHEEGLIGNIQDGFRNEAMLIGQCRR